MVTGAGGEGNGDLSFKRSPVLVLQDEKRSGYGMHNTLNILVTTDCTL